MMKEMDEYAKECMEDFQLALNPIMFERYPDGVDLDNILIRVMKLHEYKKLRQVLDAASLKNELDKVCKRIEIRRDALINKEGEAYKRFMTGMPYEDEQFYASLLGEEKKRVGRQECNGEKQSGRNGINNKNDKENPEIQHIRHLLDIIERTIEGELTEQDVIELKQDVNNWDEDIKKLKKMIASLNIDSII